jgi:DNA gyrase/topoisomerase IV subunit A
VLYSTKGTAMTSSTAEILNISIEEEMRKSYLDYAMSVIVSRDSGCT